MNEKHKKALKINYYKKGTTKGTSVEATLAQVKNNCVSIDWKLGFAQVKKYSWKAANTLFADLSWIFTVIAKVFPFKSLRKSQKSLSEIAFYWFSTNLLSMHFHILYKRSEQNSFLFIFNLFFYPNVKSANVWFQIEWFMLK